MDLLELNQQGENVSFVVRVAPRSSRSAVIGILQGALKVSLTAPPVDGAANAALVKLLSQTLDIPKSAIKIVRGERSKMKTVRIEGMDSKAIKDALSKSL
jgi:uncharacterized protein